MPNVCENVLSDSNDDSFYLCSYRNTWAILYFYTVIFLLILFFLGQCSAAMNAFIIMHGFSIPLSVRFNFT